MSLKDIYNGKQMNIMLTKNTICSHCRGSGAEDPSDIQKCDKC